jgi:hypothetical protein
VGDVDVGGICVTARWRGARVLRGAGVRAAGVGEVVGNISGVETGSSLMSWPSREYSELESALLLARDIDLLRPGSKSNFGFCPAAMASNI